jgi:hypothetical protein
MVRRFEEESTLARRALQVYMILIGLARSRQTIKYDALGTKMYGKTVTLPLGQELGYVAFYCMREELPPLTAIVVNSTGIPGRGFPGHAEGEDINLARERVYEYDWFAIFPPKVRELEEAKTWWLERAG